MTNDQERPTASGARVTVPSLGRRLVTHNLLHEAAYFESAPNLTWYPIHELSVFIDLFCLYDDVAVLDWHLRSFPRDRTSEFFTLLEDERFIKNHEVSGDQEVMNSTCARLGVFLGKNASIGHCREIVALCTKPALVAQVASFFPREQKELQCGWDLLKTKGHEKHFQINFENDKDVLLSSVFLVRTFLYLSLAEQLKMPFVPDLARSHPSLQMTTGERNLRQRVIEKLGDVFQAKALDIDVELARNVTPLASLVFDRASDKKDVVRQMAQLRHELAPLRVRLRRFEDIIQHGTLAEEIAAKRKWKSAFGELQHEFGVDEDSVRSHPLVKLLGVASKILAQPTSLGNWIEAVMAQPNESLLRILDKRPLIEIYQSRREMPATGRLRADIARLFDV
jgi:hypothetical protein